MSFASHLERIRSQPNLSAAAKRLLAMQYPVHCRTEEERLGLERWQAEAANLMSEVNRVTATFRSATTLRDEMLDCGNEAFQYRVLWLLGRTMGLLVDTADLGEPAAAAAVWRVVLSAGIRARKFGARFRETDLSENADCVRLALEEMFSRASEDESLAIEALLDGGDDELGIIPHEVPRDFAAEALGVTEAAVTSTFITAEQTARFQNCFENHVVELAQGAKRAETLKAELQACARHCARVIADSQRLMPATGELADLSDQITMLIDLMHITAGERPEISEMQSRVNYRMGVWFELHDIRWTQEAREILTALIEAPRQFVRFTARTPDGQNTKARLRRMRDLFLGSRPTVELASLVQNIRSAATDQEVLWVFTEYLLTRYDSNPAGSTVAEVSAKFSDAWFECVAFDSANALRLLGNAVAYDGVARLRTSIDVEVERLEAEEAALTPPAPPTSPLPVELRHFTPPPAPPPRTTPRTETWNLVYVLNPEGATPQEVREECDKDEIFGTLVRLLEEHAEVTEPNASLARAIYHHAFALTPEQRFTWSKERLGNYTFHKLKRGRARIYVRVAGQAITFHVYNRRDWDKDWLL